MTIHLETVVMSFHDLRKNQKRKIFIEINKFSNCSDLSRYLMMKILKLKDNMFGFYLIIVLLHRITAVFITILQNRFRFIKTTLQSFISERVVDGLL